MKAVCFSGTHNITVEREPDPELIMPTYILLRDTSTARGWLPLPLPRNAA
jgi:hypothetical protein